MTWNWDDFNIINNNYHTFFNVLTHNALFPNEEITAKVNSSKILKNSGKWIISIKSICEELVRLKKLFSEIHSYAFMYYLISYLRINVMKSVLDSINANQNTNENKDIDLDKLLRNRKRSEKIDKDSDVFLKKIENTFEKTVQSKGDRKPIQKLLKKVDNPGDYFLKNILATLTKHNTSEIGELKANKQIKGLFTGDAHEFMRLLPLDSITHHGTNKIYRNLFPLFKLVIQDKILLSEQEYNDQNNANYDSYDKYMIANVKIILGKT